MYTVPAHLEKYMGRFISPDKKEITVRSENGLLVLVLPGNQALPFNPPDEQGRWYCKLVNYIYLVMKEADSGEVRAIDFHQVLNLPKTSPLKKVSGDTPESLKPYLGNYEYKPAKITLTVSYRDKGLSVFYSHTKRSVKISATGKPGFFIDPIRRTFLFERDDKGEVTGMKWNVVEVLKRK